MKRLLTFAATIVMLLPTQAQKRLGGYPITPVTFTSVKVAPNSFWGQRLEASRKVTIPLAFSKCEETGRYKHFEHAAAHLKDPSKVFPVLVEYIPLIFTFPSFKRAAAIAFVKAFLRCSKKRSFFHITKLQALSEQ